MERTRWIVSGCAERRPMMVSITIGKKAMANAIRTFDVIPVPSQTMKIGAIAAFGMVWNATSKG